MKTLKVLALTISIAFFAASCVSNSKADTWSGDQKATWTQSCLEFMAEQGVDDKNAEGFCDCMLKKTSEKYTPEEAASISTEEERKLWEECDYNW